MERRKFTREFKLEAVHLIKDRGVSYAQASEVHLQLLVVSAASWSFAAAMPACPRILSSVFHGRLERRCESSPNASAVGQIGKVGTHVELAHGLYRWYTRFCASFLSH